MKLQIKVIPKGDSISEGFAAQRIMQDICTKIESSEFEMDLEEFAQNKALEIVEQIARVMSISNLSDFERVDKIICILEDNGISCGNCHDF